MNKKNKAKWKCTAIVLLCLAGATQAADPPLGSTPKTENNKSGSTPKIANSADSAIRELTLNECIALALENNLEVRIERLTRSVAKQDIEVARGGYDPQLSFSAKRNHEETSGSSADTADGVLEVLGSESDNDALALSLGGVTRLGGLKYDLGTRLGSTEGTRNANPFDTSTGSATLTLTQPLLKGFKSDSVRYQVATSRSLSAEAAAQLDAQIQAILGQVENAWHNVIAARESIRVQEDAVRLATQLYEDNRRKVQIGTLAQLDEKQAASQAASARATLSSARRVLSETQNRLKAILFADHRAMRDTTLLPVGELTDELIAMDVLISSERALEQRPDLRQARKAIERQGITVAYQKNQTLPALDFIGSAGVAASDEPSTSQVWDRLSAADEPFWSAGVTLTFPLGNRAAKVRYAQSRTNEEKQKLKLRQLEETALVEVENAVAAVHTGHEKLLATRESRDYAQQALDAEQRKLESGKSTSFIVLQLQRDLTNARNDALQALVEYNRQQTILALAEGTMLDRHQIEFAK